MLRSSLRDPTLGGAHLLRAKRPISHPPGTPHKSLDCGNCSGVVSAREIGNGSIGRSDRIPRENGGSRKPHSQHSKWTRSGSGAWHVRAYHGDAGTEGKTGSNGGRSSPAGRYGRSTSSTDATSRHNANVVALRTPNSRAGDRRLVIAPRRTWGTRLLGATSNNRQPVWNQVTNLTSKGVRCQRKAAVRSGSLY